MSAERRHAWDHGRQWLALAVVALAVLPPAIGAWAPAAATIRTQRSRGGTATGAGGGTTTRVAGRAGVPAAVSGAPSITALGVSAQPAASVISPQSLGHHLMYFASLTPAIPVHAMRLWDSNTEWCQIDNGTASNQYDFGQLDALLGQASRLNADVEFTFGDTPQWAVTGAYPQSGVTGQCSSTASPPAQEAYWTNFVTALVSHAAGRIHAYELWNEADWSAYWSGSVAQLLQMSVDAAAIIHRLDPSALVLAPSVTDTARGWAFLKQYLSSLPAGTVDAIAVHSYTGGAWPEGAVSAEMTALRAALPAAYLGLPIWSTEGGWGQNSQFSSDASSQRAFVARYDLQMLAQGFARSYWYAYPNTQWGTLWDGTSLTPAGIATGTLDAWLVGAVLVGCATQDSNLWTCDLVTSGGRAARIVWVTTTPVSGYSTTGYSVVNTLDGGSSASGGQAITVTTEPVMLSS